MNPQHSAQLAILIILGWLQAPASQANGLEIGVAKLSQIKRGEEIFKQNCVACHGVTGEGNGPAVKVMKAKPRNFIQETFKFGSQPEQIFQTITKGIPGTPMPSWESLPEEDRWAVISFILKFPEKRTKRACK